MNNALRILKIAIAFLVAVAGAIYMAVLAQPAPAKSQSEYRVSLPVVMRDTPPTSDVGQPPTP